MLNRKMILVFVLVLSTVMPASALANRLPSFELPKRELPRHELPDFRLPELSPLETPELSVNFDERVNDLRESGLGEDYVLPEIQMREMPELRKPTTERLIPEGDIIPRPSESFFGRLRRFSLRSLPGLSSLRAFNPGHDLDAKETDGRDKMLTEEERAQYLEEAPKPENYEEARERMRQGEEIISESKEEVEQSVLADAHDTTSDQISGIARFFRGGSQVLSDWQGAIRSLFR